MLKQFTGVVLTIQSARRWFLQTGEPEFWQYLLASTSIYNEENVIFLRGKLLLVMRARENSHANYGGIINM